MTDVLFAGLDFGNDVSLAGFRLRRLELLNWGTFDRSTYVVDLDGRNGLLTGDIGSGKSTVVDAITTLLVPPAKLAYNKAAGADTKERTLATYVLGNYKAERSDSGHAAKAVTLRDHKTMCVLLGVFHNDGYDETLTLAQVFYFKKAEGQPDRFYVSSPNDLTINGDVLPLATSIPDLRRGLRDAGATIEDSFEKYRAGFSRILGIRNPQALDLFHQTVSMKQVGNLTDFVRSHMLEPFDVADRRVRLLDHFDNLTRAHAAIQKAKRQIAMLTPLAERLALLRDTTETIATDRSSRDGITAYFADKKTGLLQNRLAKLRTDAERVDSRLEGIERDVSAMRLTQNQLNVDIARSGGDRLTELQAQITVLDGTIAKRRDAYTTFAASVESVGLRLPKDAEELVTTLHDAAEARANADAALAEADNEGNELAYAMRNAKDEAKSLSDEIDSLKKRENNLPGHAIELRNRICAGTGLDDAALPYVGELLAVDDAHTAWEGAAERVLRPFATSMLVPAEHYRAVADWVDANHLRGRLVYYRVPESTAEPVVDVDSDSLVHRINVKPKTPHGAWLTAELVRRFDYTCCSDMRDFARAAKAITARGHIKSGGSKHEKDDRSAIGDRSRYVLGWSNAPKIKALTAQLGNAQAEVQRVGGELERIAAVRAAHRATCDACLAVSHFDRFEDIDWEGAAHERQRVADALRELEAASDVLAALRSQLAEVTANLAEKEAAQRRASEERGGIASKIDRAVADVEELARVVDDGALSDDVRSRLDGWLSQQFADTALTVENCDATSIRLRKQIQANLDRVTAQWDRHKTFVVAQMQAFKGEYPLECKDFDADIDAGPEYEALLEKLHGDDLPRFETTFKDMLNKNAIHEIAAFHAALDGEAVEITRRIGQINEALDKIEYNPGRRIVVERHTGEDREVAEFQADLRACLHDAVGGDASGAYSETRFEQVKKILDRFAYREGFAEADKRWTDKVTDVRNWFTFSASERWREDDTEHEHYTDSGGKSGGQKEKLAYTILAASLAYKFGLDWGEVRSRSLRFVVIDEAFGRGSDESAEYGLKLFEALNLQLMIVTPLQKIHVIEPHVHSVTYVSNPGGDTSRLRTMTMQEYREQRDARRVELAEASGARVDAASGDRSA